MICLGPSGFGPAGKEAQCSRSTSIKPFCVVSYRRCSAPRQAAPFFFVRRIPVTRVTLGADQVSPSSAGPYPPCRPLQAIPLRGLRFRAAIRSITGAGALTVRGLIGRPLDLGLDQLSQRLLITVSVCAWVEFAGPLSNDCPSDGHHLGIKVTLGAAELRCPNLIRGAQREQRHQLPVACRAQAGGISWKKAGSSKSSSARRLTPLVAPAGRAKRGYSRSTGTPSSRENRNSRSRY
jgi:hypothetical protein